MWQGTVRAGSGALEGANGKGRVLVWLGFEALGSGPKSTQAESHP